MSGRPQNSLRTGAASFKRVLGSVGLRTNAQLERSPSLFTGNVIAGTQEFENPGDSPRALQLGFVLPQHPSELLIKHLGIVRLGRLVTLGIGLVVRTDRGQLSWIKENPFTFRALVHDHVPSNAPKMAHHDD